MQPEGKIDIDSLECNCQLLPTVQLLVSKYQRSVDSETNANLSAHEPKPSEISEYTVRRLSGNGNRASNLSNDGYTSSDGVSEISSNSSVGSTHQFLRIPNIRCPLHSRSSEQHESDSYFVRVFNETESRKNRSKRFSCGTIGGGSNAVFPVTNCLHFSRVSTMTSAGISKLKHVGTRRAARSDAVSTSLVLEKKKSSSIDADGNSRKCSFHFIMIILIIGLLLLFSVVLALILTNRKPKSKCGLWGILWVLYGAK